TAQSNTATCTPPSFPDRISVTKNCNPGASLVAQNGLVAVEVGVSGTVTNGSSNNLTLSNVTVYDCVNGTFAMPGSGKCPTVDPNSCTTNGGTLRTVKTISSLTTTTPQGYTDTYFPSVAPSCGPFNFNDQVLV